MITREESKSLKFLHKMRVNIIKSGNYYSQERKKLDEAIEELESQLQLVNNEQLACETCEYGDGDIAFLNGIDCNECSVVYKNKHKLNDTK